jgi:hypothetical protein
VLEDTAALVSEVTHYFQDCLGGEQILHDIIICEEIASECLPYASPAPKRVQIPAFLNPRLSDLEMGF